MIHSYAYLFMLLPPLRVRDRIITAINLTGPIRSPVPHHLLHMTLAEIANLSERRPEIVEKMRAVLANHQLRACTFALRQLVVETEIATLKTVGRRPELNALRADLSALLVNAGIPRSWAKTFTPHVTLGRGIFSRQERRIDPIFWHADRLALVESWRGARHYEIQETWPLLPPIQGSFDFDCAA